MSCITSRVAAVAMLILSCQSLSAQVPSTTKVATGATIGAVAGAAVGAIGGAAFTSRNCPSSHLEECLSLAAPGFVWGIGGGTTLGAPIGAHVAGGRRGNLVLSLAASTALLAVEAIALNHYVDGERIKNKPAATAIVVLVPLSQIISSVLIERRASR